MKCLVAVKSKSKIVCFPSYCTVDTVMYIRYLNINKNKNIYWIMTEDDITHNLCKIKILLSLRRRSRQTEMKENVEKMDCNNMLKQ